MDYALYKVAHFVSIIAMMFSLGRSNRFFTLFWLLTFATSFGLVSALGLHENFPAWANTKFYLWILIGLMALTMKFKPRLGKAFTVLISLMAIAAVVLAVYKPF